MLRGAKNDCLSIESIYYNGQNPDVTWTGNTFTNWGAVESVVEPDAVGNLSSANSFVLVAGATTRVAGGTVARDARAPA